MYTCSILCWFLFQTKIILKKYSFDYNWRTWVFSSIHLELEVRYWIAEDVIKKKKAGSEKRMQRQGVLMYRTVLVADSIRWSILPSSPPQKKSSIKLTTSTVQRKLKKSEIKAHVFASWSHGSPGERDSSWIKMKPSTAFDLSPALSKCPPGAHCENMASFLSVSTCEFEAIPTMRITWVSYSYFPSRSKIAKSK